MPPLPAVPNVFKIIVKGISGEATPLNWANILHWVWSGTTPTVSTCQAIATKVNAEWATNMSPEQVNNITQTETEVIDLTSATAASAVESASNAGTRGDDEIPANVAFLVDYLITRRYRGGHPRSYLIVGGNADFLDAAHWSTAFTAEVATHWSDFLGALSGFTTAGTTLGNQCQVSYVDKALNPVPPYYRTIPVVDQFTGSYIEAQQQMASQRRRIGRHRK